MKKFICLLITLTMLFSLCTFAETDPDFSLDYTGKSMYRAGETFKVELTINSISQKIVDNSGISLIKFDLCYDSKVVEPVLKNDFDNDNKSMDSIITAAPGKDWEMLTKLNEESSRYEINALSASTGEGVIKDGTLVFRVDFKVIGAPETISFSLSNITARVWDDMMNEIAIPDVDIKATLNTAEPDETLNSVFEEELTFGEAGDDKAAFGIGLDAKAESIISENVKITDASGKELAASGIIGTGCILKLYNTAGEVVDEAVIVVKGDLTGDGVVAAKDYVLVKRIFLKTVEVSDAALLAADIDGNGEIQPKDYVFEKRIALGTYTIE